MCSRTTVTSSYRIAVRLSGQRVCGTFPESSGDHEPWSGIRWDPWARDWPSVESHSVYGAEQSCKPLVREARKTWVEELTSWGRSFEPDEWVSRILLVMSSVAHTNAPGGPLVEAGAEDSRRAGMLGAPALHPQSQ
jgi:hypothetical protein